MPLVMADATPWSVLRKPGAALFSAFCIEVAIIPRGVMVLATDSEALMVAVTKLRNAVLV